MRDGNRRGFSGKGLPHTSGINGAHPDTDTRPTALADHKDIDFVAVQADDELINALASGMAVSAPGVGGYDADDHVAAILAAWKVEVDAEPMPELVDLDTAVAAVVGARQQSRRARHLAPVAAAAAFVVLAIGGVSVGSSDARPGDALWPVSKVLYSERAESVEAAERVETRIAKAKQALMEGQPIVAAIELQQAEVDLTAVRPEEGRADLAEVQDFLAAKAEETPVGIRTDPGTPLTTDQARRVPAGAAIDAPADTPTPASSTLPAPVVVSPDPALEAPSETPDPGATPTPTPAPDSNPATPGTDTSDPPQATVEGTGSAGESLDATPSGGTEGTTDTGTPT